MKKVAAAITSSYLFLKQLSGVVFAEKIDITVTPPNKGVTQDPQKIGEIISSALILAYGIALLVVLVFLILGAFNWITSGGDKEKVKTARGQIVHALIGVAILAFAVLITNLAARILNLGNIFQFEIPILPKAG